MPDAIPEPRSKPFEICISRLPTRRWIGRTRWQSANTQRRWARLTHRSRTSRLFGRAGSGWRACLVLIKNKKLNRNRVWRDRRSHPLDVAKAILELRPERSNRGFSRAPFTGGLDLDALGDEAGRSPAELC